MASSPSWLHRCWRRSLRRLLILAAPAASSHILLQTLLCVPPTLCFHEAAGMMARPPPAPAAPCVRCHCYCCRWYAGTGGGVGGVWHARDRTSGQFSSNHSDNAISINQRHHRDILGGATSAVSDTAKSRGVPRLPPPLPPLNTPLLQPPNHTHTHTRRMRSSTCPSSLAHLCAVVVLCVLAASSTNAQPWRQQGPTCRMEHDAAHQYCGLPFQLCRCPVSSGGKT
jgi:hypothetical protein